MDFIRNKLIIFLSFSMLIGCDSGGSLSNEKKVNDIPSVNGTMPGETLTFKGKGNDWNVVFRSERNKSSEESRIETLTLEYIGKNTKVITPVQYSIKSNKEVIQAGTQYLNTDRKVIQNTKCTGCMSLVVPKDSLIIKISFNNSIEIVPLELK